MATLGIGPGWLLASGWNETAAAQSGVHGTLRGWEESAWLQVLDRNASLAGSLSDLGILQRFPEDIDAKYHFDLLTAAFPMHEEYEWYRRDQGVRWLTGSITKRDLIADAEFKALVPIGGRWNVAVRFDKEDNPEVRRNTFRVAFRRAFGSRLVGFVGSQLDPVKPGSDFEAGVEWRVRGGGEVRLTVAILDAFNDLIYKKLDAVHQRQIDTTLEYERQPVAARLGTAFRLGRSARIEAYGGFVRPSTILAYEARDAAAGFRQSERLVYGGGLLEWTPSRAIAVGGFLTVIRARSERAGLSDEAPVEAYRLTEHTAEAGFFWISRISKRWIADIWVRHAWRPQQRLFDDANQEDLDREFRSLNAQAVMLYEAPTGFRGELGVLTTHGHVRGPASDLPFRHLEGDHYRFRFDVGWNFNDRFSFLAGAALDLDTNRDETSFGGGRGRFMMFW